MSKLITILGPTASGKTALAVKMAIELDGEIISADSRQVYRGMDIGTGKDLHEYEVDGKIVPVHLTDIADPGEEYNVYRFRRDFSEAFTDITARGKQPILCGGSGMYLSSVLQNYHFPKIVSNEKETELLEQKTDEELISILKSIRTPHNTTDLLDRTRLIRAILIGKSQEIITRLPHIDEMVTIGILRDRHDLRLRITRRLEYRLEHGMIEEVQSLLHSGLTPEQLKFYGLEYRYITSYLMNEINYNEMFRLLNIAIHQFAKRQMTWFRKMERDGVIIKWLTNSSL